MKRILSNDDIRIIADHERSRMGDSKMTPELVAVAKEIFSRLLFVVPEMHQTRLDDDRILMGCIVMQFCRELRKAGSPKGVVLNPFDVAQQLLMGTLTNCIGSDWDCMHVDRTKQSRGLFAYRSFDDGVLILEETLSNWIANH